MSHFLPFDKARCRGVGDDEGGTLPWEWREGCEDCLRRLAPGGERQMEPPPVVAFECEYRIPV